MKKRIGFLLATAFLVGACAQGAREERMVAPASAATASLPGDPEYQSVAVAEVTGGKATNPLWMSNVNSTAIKNALVKSLDATGMLAPNPDEAIYTLTAQMQELKRPFIGLQMTVKSRINYEVIEVRSGVMFMQQSVAAEGAAKVSDAFIGSERLRIANEISVRNNINDLVAKLRDAIRTYAADKGVPSATSASGTPTS